MLRQAKNEVWIEGILSEIDLKYGSYVKNGSTVDNIGGSIKVLVRQTVNGEEQTLTIPVYMFSAKYTKDGKLNPSYESIEKVMKEFVSIAAAGGEAGADHVRMKASLTVNEYYNQQGQLVSYPRVKASFVSRVTGEFRPHADWDMEFAVASHNYVVDKDGIEVEPKKLCVKVLVPQYGGAVDALELYATNPNVIDAINTYWEPNKTYTAKGRLNFVTTSTEVIEECDFGEPDVKVKTTTKSEVLITKGTQNPLEDGREFAPAELKEGLAARQARLEALKNKAENKATPAPASSASNAAFDLGF